ncbi:MAG TPA: YihY/virulence factor BrkB family protein [Acetobacteraceae bacterium]
MALLRQCWTMGKDTVVAFVDDGALSRGASIAFYTVISIAPVLFIVIAIAGLVFGDDAAQGAIVHQLSGLMGRESAELLQNAIKSASGTRSSVIATIIGVVVLLVAASGMFGEIQTALNAIWKAQPQGTTVSRLIRSRVVSLGLVVALGFLLLLSLATSTVLAALRGYADEFLPFSTQILEVVNFFISFALVAGLFAAIYKMLPDCDLDWHDAAVGALVTALLFTIGKYMIGLYVGSSVVASAYGAAGALIVILLWIYYSAQIFLLGAEFTKVYADYRGRRKARARNPAEVA